jgi:hypothetical protein
MSNSTIFTDTGALVPADYGDPVARISDLKPERSGVAIADLRCNPRRHCGLMGVDRFGPLGGRRNRLREGGRMLRDGVDYTMAIEFKVVSGFAEIEQFGLGASGVNNARFRLRADGTFNTRTEWNTRNFLVIDLGDGWRRLSVTFTPNQVAEQSMGIWFDGNSAESENIYRIRAARPMLVEGEVEGDFQEVKASGFDVTQEGVPNPTYLRFDLSDDKMTHTFPNGFTGDVMLFGRNGSWVEENVTIAPNGGLDIGPRAVTGGIPGSLDAIGDVVGWLPVGRVLSAQERQYMTDYYKERGAKGLLVPGPELVPNGDFSDGLTGWSQDNTSVWEVIDGKATIAAESTSGFPIIFRSGLGLSFSRYYLYTIESNRNSLQRMSLGVSTDGGNILRRARALGSHWIHEGISRPLGGTTSIGIQFTGTSIGSWIDNVSVRELRPQEEW